MAPKNTIALEGAAHRSAGCASIVLARVGHDMVERGLPTPDAQMRASGDLPVAIPDLPAPSLGSAGRVTPER